MWRVDTAPTPGQETNAMTEREICLEINLIELYCSLFFVQSIMFALCQVSQRIQFKHLSLPVLLNISNK